MRRFTSSYFRTRDLSRGVRLVAAARAIRWIGWGFGEALLPIFFVQFSSSLTEAGLLQATMQMVFLIIFPLVGMLADTFPARTLLIAAALFYPFIGLSFYVAGISGLILFVIL